MFENIDKLLDGLEAKGIKIAINTNKSTIEP
jgi:phosphoglycolate phosphatase-like HAD superfamily hydrolase